MYKWKPSAIHLCQTQNSENTMKKILPLLLCNREINNNSFIPCIYGNKYYNYLKCKYFLWCHQKQDLIVDSFTSAVNKTQLLIEPWEIIHKNNIKNAVGLLSQLPNLSKDPQNLILSTSKTRAILDETKL